MYRKHMMTRSFMEENMLNETIFYYVHVKPAHPTIRMFTIYVCTTMSSTMCARTVQSNILQG